VNKADGERVIEAVRKAWPGHGWSQERFVEFLRDVKPMRLDDVLGAIDELSARGCWLAPGRDPLVRECRAFARRRAEERSKTSAQRDRESADRAHLEREGAARLLNEWADSKSDEDLAALCERLEPSVRTIVRRRRDLDGGGWPAVRRSASCLTLLRSAEASGALVHREVA